MIKRAVNASEMHVLSEVVGKQTPCSIGSLRAKRSNPHRGLVHVHSCQPKLGSDRGSLQIKANRASLVGGLPYL